MKIVIPSKFGGAGEGKTALVTGVYGQDGSYMLDLLLALGYRKVWGASREVSTRDKRNVAHNLSDPRYDFVEMDVSDPTSVDHALADTKPDEVYNFAALSRVGPSFKQQTAYMKTNALGPLYIVKAIQKHCPEARMYQACTSEQYGASPAPQGYDTPFKPDSPYATAKLESYWMCLNESSAGNGFFVPCILFNHESPRRPEYFVTMKILMGLLRIKKAIDGGHPFHPLGLGNLSAERDWGYAPEYVFLAWLALQQDKPWPLIAGTGRAFGVDTFLTHAAVLVGLGNVPNVTNPETDFWSLEVGGNVVAQADKRFYRPMKKNELRADPEALQKTYDRCGWRAGVGMVALQKIMVAALAGGGERDVVFGSD